MNRILTPILVLWCLSAHFYSWSQPNQGVPFITNYTNSDYKQGTQNFAVVQDNRGLLYFGNNNGVLEYDGITWRLIQVSNKSEVHSLALDANGKMYVGAQGDFGYLALDDKSGKLIYKSMLHLLDSSFHDFNDVWNIYIGKDNVIFRSTSGIYVYESDTVKALPLHHSNHRSAYLYDTLLVWEDDFGLMKVENGSLKLLPHGEYFKNIPVHSMFAYPGNKILLITPEDGFFIFDGKDFTPFKTEIDSIIKGQSIYGQQLPDKTYALGTRRNGLLIIDTLGRLIHHIDRSSGLQDESVWSICSDRLTGDLWLAMNNGVSLVEISSPFSRFGVESGVRGQFYHVLKHDNKIYGAGSVGVYVKEWLKDDDSKLGLSSHFKPMPNTQTQTWYFYGDEDQLLVAGNTGILEIKDDRVSNIGFHNRAWFFLPLKDHPGYLLANTAEGLLLLKKEKKNWRVYRKLGIPFTSLYYFAQDAHGNIWADNPIKGVYRINFNKGIDADPEMILFNHKNGLPSDLKVKAFDLHGEVVFGTEQGVYQYDTDTESFIPHQILNEVLFDYKLLEVEWLEMDQEKNIWFVVKDYVEEEKRSFPGYAEYKLGKYLVKKDVFQKIQNYKIRDFYYIDKTNIVLGTSDGMIHYNPTKEKQPEFNVLLRKVEVIGSDSVLFNGSFYNASGELSSNQTDLFSYSLPYTSNSLRFSFSSMDYKVPASNLYQFYLEGFDKNWGVWSTNTSKEYTNLPEGVYKLHVRARNQYNQLSNLQVFAFEVYPPWYRTIVSYILYLVLAALLLVVIMRVYANNLRSQNNRLERMVSERTSEVRKQNEDIMEKNQLLENQKEEIESQKEDILIKNQELEKARTIITNQYEELKNVNFNLEQKVNLRTEELRKAYQDLLVLKNELETFIYKSSHDIKGPMMRLRGLCQVALMDVTDEKAMGYIKMLQNEAEGTIKVLQKLLIFYDVKNKVPQANKHRLEHALESIVADLKRSMEIGASAQIKLNYAKDLPELNTDPELLNIALTHLIENAFIFRRPENSYIDISVELDDKRNIMLLISDNGVGIPKEIEHRVFDMFYRGSERSLGPGLGLYTAREAARKLGGDITLNQKPGLTTFLVFFPVNLMIERTGAVNNLL